ncbi:MAG: hypothetical protein P8X79_04185 [Reinekea sp.]
MLPKNYGEPTGAPATFEEQIEIKLLLPDFTLESRIQGSVNTIRYRNRNLCLKYFGSILKYVTMNATCRVSLIMRSIRIIWNIPGTNTCSVAAVISPN